MEHQEASRTPHANGGRQRAFATKVRTGCRPCKAAHVRCDEQTPTCARCVRLHKQCKYTPIRRQFGMSGTYGVFRDLLPAATTSDQPPRLHEPALITLTPKEVVYFDHFRYRVIHQLGSVGTSDFWIRTVLRESMQDLCVLDCLLGLGALDYARKSDPAANAPLFKSSLQEPPLRYSYYYDALTYYTRSLGRFRKRIAISAIAPRTLLITTILFSVFELLQGNTSLVDQLAAFSIRMLKDVVLQATPASGRDSLIAATLDDDGILEAEYLLVRMTCFNIGYSPLYPKAREALSSCSFPFLQSLAPFDVTESTEAFGAQWRRFLTRIVFWYIRAGLILAREGPTEAIAQLSHEQGVLLSYIEAWRTEIQCKLGAAHDPLQRLHLRQLIIMASGTFYAILAAFDATGSLWTTHKDAILDILMLSESVFEETRPEFRQQDVIFEGVLPVVAHFALQCRERDLRRKARLLWQRMVSSQSSWDVKGIFLGSSAVIAAEEKARTVDGCIPMTSLFEWIDGAWNDDHTEFYATLRPKFPDKDGNAERFQLSLNCKDYGCT